MPDPYELDSRAVRRVFDKAAADYDASAVLQHEVSARLLERLQYIRGSPKSVLDLGAGTCRGTLALQERFQRAEIVALDFSAAMLRQAQAPLSRVCADAESLPLRDQSIDWCVSNLLLAWCNPEVVFREVRRVLQDDGVFTFTTFGPDTLRELRAAWKAVDANPHVHRFIDMHDLGDALVHSGFAEPVMDVERIVLTYGDANRLMQELKDTGAATALRDRPRHLAQRSKLNALTSAYDQQRRDDRLIATFEIIYGQAWRVKDREREHSGEVRISADSLRGRRR